MQHVERCEYPVVCVRFWWLFSPLGVARVSETCVVEGLMLVLCVSYFSPATDRYLER